MTDTAIRVRGLCKRYENVTALGKVNLDIPRGEVFALLGPNGAGKTTAVEIMEGYRKRDAGEVAVLGEDPALAGRAWRSRIGIVLQSASDAAELTVTEYVSHLARYYPRPTDPDEIIDRAGLSQWAGIRIRKLSGGSRRRLDVALSLVGNPELIFLDEPTTGFDPEARRHFWEVIRQLATTGVTVLLTTHYMDEAEALADRLAILVSGRIVTSGRLPELARQAGALTTVSWAGSGGRQSVQTDTPTRTVRELADQFDGEVPGLAVYSPSLEDMYLRLVRETAQ